MEEELGFTLLERSSRSVKLTGAGEILLERARRTMSRVGRDLEAARRVARGEEGTLTIGFFRSAMLTKLPEALRRFREGYPRVQLKLTELSTARLIDANRRRQR